MIDKIKDFFDLETGKVLAASSGGMGVSFTNMDHFFKLVIGLGTAIYIWKKVLRKKTKTTITETNTVTEEEETDV